MEPEATRLSLLVRARDPADAAAWAELEHRYRDLVHQYALARGLQFCDADDVCQVVFLRLSKYLRGFAYSPERGRFRSYLGAIVRNVISDQMDCPGARRRQVDENEARLDEFPDLRTLEDDEQWDREWVNHHCRLALATIRRTFDPRSIDVFEALLAGLSPESVAADRGCSIDAVVKIRQRVRTRMQELIESQIRDEDGK
ncbi:MAG: sigma-70 family RNA polymerase sigma factor [Phycisphaerales bacterium]|nr:sigma-70 family RNA polymerase sigma factor [Phycisphaerales bacterium]